ncbi:septin-2-like [Actinia tenebrosa]|uniref:Septin n=1 Tax=Actinia tenebrosa TaxID=6105 RepID=A0A6P8HW50_ACTTE|nr:septin-2-like [Actinia tenebrosa]
MSRNGKGIEDQEAGYVGFANLPNQVHRKSVKKGFEFTLMVVGESGLGKSTLIESLFLTDIYDDNKIPPVIDRIYQTLNIETNTVEIEEKGIKLKLTVVDTPGFADAVDNTDCWQAILDYINKQFESYLRDESGLNRRNIVDTRVHCCLYFINPHGHGLRPVDVQFMQALHNKVNIVPVIAKADCLTKHELSRLKRKVLNELEDNSIKIYTFPDCESDDDEEFIEINKELKMTVPFAVIGSNRLIESRGRKIRVRQYPWGYAEVENPDHCDFVMLRNFLVRTHMQDLKDVTQDIHYENYRAERLSRETGTPVGYKKVQDMKRKSGTYDSIDATMSEKDKMLREKELELKRMQAMLAQMQKEIQQQNVSKVNFRFHCNFQFSFPRFLQKERT